MKRYTLGPLLIDSEQKLLYRADERISLAHKPTAILLLLLENAGRVVLRSTIREAFWPDAFVDEAIISRNISLIRSALRPHLEDLNPIETISKSGYRFTGPLAIENHHRRRANDMNHSSTSHPDSHVER